MTERMFSPRELAELFSVSRDVVYREIRKGRLRGERVFGRVRVPESEVDRYREEGRIRRREREVPARSARSGPGERGSLARLREIERERGAA